MRPRKVRPVKNKYAEICREKGIRLRGSVRRDNWPREHRHHFQAIYSIGSTQFEQYIGNQEIPQERRTTVENDVVSLTQKVNDLLNDIQTNEATWRRLERDILHKFDDFVLCVKCSNERWKPDFEANFSDPEEQEKLCQKRNTRKMCTCKHGQMVPKANNNDDEEQHLFLVAESSAVSHVAGDDFGNLSVSMKPDLVYGLKDTLRVPQSDFLFPVRDRGLLLPFLVLEAKKEHSSSGFTAIQHQTALPIRRFLKAQEEFRSRDSCKEPSLVWFFANQGDVWRLHMGIWKRDQVKIYNLWLGTIQSEDNALQLLLIVDYIWSWARDIYRPTVRKILSNSGMTSRCFSPTATERSCQSLPVDPARFSTPHAHDSDIMQIDEVAGPSGSLTNPLQVEDDEPPNNHDRIPSALEDPNIHRISESLNKIDENPPSWAQLGTVRDPNTAEFEFRVYDAADVLNFDEIFQARENSGLDLDILYNHRFRLSSDYLSTLATVWTGKVVLIDTFNISKTIEATFIFQTYCDQSVWRLRRVLNCILWKTALFETDSFNAFMFSSLLEPEYLSIPRFEESVRNLRNIHGRQSVWYALRSLSIVLSGGSSDNPDRSLSHGLEGLSGTAEDFEAQMRQSSKGLKRICIHRGICRVTEGVGNDGRSVISDVEKDLRSGNSMLVMRSLHQTSNTAKFCLFILSDAREDEPFAGFVRRLLKEAMALKNFYAQDSIEGVSAVWDWDTLIEWRKELKS